MADDIRLVIGVEKKGVLSAITATETLEKKVKKLSDTYARGGITTSEYNKGIAQLAKATKQSESKLLSHGKAIRDNNAAMKAAAVAAKQQSDAAKAAAVAAKQQSDAAKAAAKQEADAVKAYAQARRQATAEDQRRQSVIKANQAAEQAAAQAARIAAQAAVKAAQDQAKAARTVADANRRLRMEFKEGYAAQVALRAAQMRLNQARRQGIITDEEYTRQLARLGDVTRQSSQHMSRSGVAMQQVGYQVGDFIVQIQSGQNPMVAFGQQATQMVGALYMLPPATLAGSVGIMGLRVSVGLLIASLGIIIPLATAIGAAWMRMKASADEAKESSDGISESLSKIEKINLSGFGGEFLSIAKSINSEFQDILNVIERVALRDLKKSLSEPLDALMASLTSYQTKLSLISQIGGTTPDFDVLGLKNQNEAVFLAAQLKTLTGETKEELQGQVQAISEALLLRGIQSDQVDKILSGLASEIGLLDDVNSAQTKAVENEEERQKRLTRILGIVGDIRTERQEEAKIKSAEDAANTAKFWADAHTQINLAKIAGQELADAAYEAFKNGQNLSELDLGKGVNAAALAAGVLAEKLQISLAAALTMVRLQGTKVYSGRGEGPQGVIKGRFVPDMNLYNSWLESQKENNKKGGGGKSPQEELAEFLTKKKEEADLQSQLVGLFGEERDLQSELIKFKQDYGKVASDTQTAEYTATVQQIAADKERQKVLEEARQQQEQLADFIANSMGDALMGIVDGTMTVKDAFRSMARDIIKQLYQVLVVQRLVGDAGKGTGIAGAIAGAFQADGGAWQGGSQIQAYANGGVVGGPTTFPMAGGKTGLMGEAGPEAIMPLKRGANGKLGVQMEGGGGDTIVVNQSFNFQANGDATIKQLIAQAAPKIAQMTKSSLLDDRRRGGSTKAAFG